MTGNTHPAESSSCTEHKSQEPMDRLSPARRPERRAVMRQSWRDLLFLHWAFDPALIRPLVPPRLELDLFDGMAYVGLVPFTMTGVRPVGLPAVRGCLTSTKLMFERTCTLRVEIPGSGS